jgi:hypothetical protein
MFVITEIIIKCPLYIIYTYISYFKLITAITYSNSLREWLTLKIYVVTSQWISYNLATVTNHPGQPYGSLHFTSPHSYVIPTAAYAVMLLLMMDMVNARNI